MISKDIIIKSIDNAIYKCGQRLTLTKTVISTFNQFAKSIRKSKVENAILTDDNGDILGTKKGKKDRLPDIYKESIKAFELNDGKAVNIDHNHPNPYQDPAPSMLSKEDILQLLQVHPDTGELLNKSISVEDSFNHSRMSVVRGDNFNLSKNENDFNKAVDFWWDNVGINSLLLHFSTTERTFKRLWSEVKDKPKVGSKEYEDLMLEVQIKANNIALEEEGFYDEFKQAQDLFRKANCRLTMDWIFD